MDPSSESKSPALSPSQPLKPAEPPADIVIHTMKDDIKQAKEGGASSASAAQLSKPQSAAKPSSFPLPPKSSGAQQKVILAPPRKRKRRHFIRNMFIFLLAIMILAGAGGAAWYFFLSEQTLSLPFMPASEELAAEASQVLPAAAVAIIEYHLDSPQDRADIILLWQSSDATLLTGNPTKLLDDPQLTEVYYVLLPDEPRPYLIVPKTETTGELLATTSQAQVLDHEGWYIAHPLNTEKYQQALIDGSRFNPSQLASPSVGQSLGPIHLTFDATTLSQIRRDSIGQHYAVGQLQDISLTATPALRGSALNFQGQGSLGSLPDNNAGNTDQELLSIIPGDVTFVRLGANFVEDLARWQEVKDILNTDILSRPAVAQFLGGLTGPYAFYLRQGEDKAEDLGLVIKLPASLRNLAFGDPTLEEALPALLPLILQQKITTPIAFTDGEYSRVPLRFVNFIARTHTLDYAILDQFLLITTSKEGMLALIDAVSGVAPSFATSGTWQNLLTASGALPQARDAIFGELNHSSLAELLPLPDQGTPPLFGFTIQPNGESVEIRGTLLQAVTEP